MSENSIKIVPSTLAEVTGTVNSTTTRQLDDAVKAGKVILDGPVLTGTAATYAWSLANPDPSDRNYSPRTYAGAAVVQAATIAALPAAIATEAGTKKWAMGPMFRDYTAGKVIATIYYV